MSLSWPSQRKCSTVSSPPITSATLMIRRCFPRELPVIRLTNIFLSFLQLQRSDSLILDDVPFRQIFDCQNLVESRKSLFCLFLTWFHICKWSSYCWRNSCGTFWMSLSDPTRTSSSAFLFPSMPLCLGTDKIIKSQISVIFDRSSLHSVNVLDVGVKVPSALIAA